jgi:3-hydroxyisobutyrate dehydrogenase-like beta-hydroxyacid dehydrogenase
VDALGAMVADLAPVIAEMITHQAEVIQAGTYENPEASVRICAKAMELFVRQAHETQINAEFPMFGLGLFTKAMAAGYGEEAVGAVIKVLRGALHRDAFSNSSSRSSIEGVGTPPL